MNKAAEYLQTREWTMGNGQCHECCGCCPGFDSGHGIVYRAQGHEPNCKVAESIAEAGFEVVYSQMEIESYFRSKATWEKMFPKEAARAKAANAYRAEVIRHFGERFFEAAKAVYK